MGSTYCGRHLGTFGASGCFSLYPAKVVTSGEGGLVVTNNKKFYEKILLIRNHGIRTTPHDNNNSKAYGLNLRMSEIHAAIAKIQMKRLPSFLKKRRQNAKILSEKLAGVDIKLPAEKRHEKFNWYLYTISANRQKSLLNKLNKAGFGATVYYSVPAHKHFSTTKNAKTLKVTQWASKHVLSLPIHPQVTDTNLSNMARIIKEELQ